MFLLLNQPSNNTLGVPMRREPGPVPGHYLILCFPERTRQTFSPSFRPESTGRCPREGWWSCGSQQELSQEQPWPIPPWRPGEEGRSVTLGKEIPPGQGGGFNPRFTEVSMSYAICFCKYVQRSFLPTTDPLRAYSRTWRQLTK